MKTYSAVIITLIVAILGYLLGSYFPIRGFFRGSEPSIAGNATLRVTVLRPDRSPAVNLEVDVASEPGAPLPGGSVKTDSSGVATFRIQPGTYSVFFNANNFPKDLLYKDSLTVSVQEGTETNRTINLHQNK